MAYSVTGSGPPLLWVSGYVVAASSLDHVVRPYAERFTCITFDHRGSGRSRPSLGPLSTVRMARDAVDVLEDLGIGSAHVYGLSLGGMVAQELAIRAPHRVRSLVLGATTAGGIGAEVPGADIVLRELDRTLRMVPGQRRVGIRAALSQGWAAATHDATSRLHRIQTPTLVIHGERDTLIPVSNARVLAGRIGRARLHVVRGAGHLYVFESEQANRTVLEWLEAHRDLPARPDARSAANLLADLSASPWHHAQAQLLPAMRSWLWMLDRLTGTSG